MQIQELSTVVVGAPHNGHCNCADPVYQHRDGGYPSKLTEQVCILWSSEKRSIALKVPKRQKKPSGSLTPQQKTETFSLWLTDPIKPGSLRHVAGKLAPHQHAASLYLSVFIKYI